MCSLLFLFILLASCGVRAWDNEELEIFDLVEEVNQNFYDYMELKSDSSTNDIRKAYRRLSLVLHPDKNSAEDASIKFRWLASIYEVLKDVKRREIYDRVLVEGLPDWKTPIFYYRRMRKMGLAEGLAYVFAILTVCHYLISWAAYYEKKFTIKEIIGSQLTKKKKKNLDEDTLKKVIEQEELKILGPKPTVYDTLPFQMVKLAKYMVTLPVVLYGAYKDHKKEMLEAEILKEKEEEEFRKREEEKRERKEKMRERKRLYKKYDEKVYEEDNSSEEEAAKNVNVFEQPKNANQMWTDDDLAKLIKLMKKFPTGTPDRWDRIADVLDRFTHEVTKMAKKIKDNAYMVPVSQKAQGLTGHEEEKNVPDANLENASQTVDSEEDSEDEEEDEESYGCYYAATKVDFEPVEVKSKVKTKGGKLLKEEEEQQEDWSQVQQKALEQALIQFPKGTTDRWDRIASKVQQKSKEQCMLRYKHIAEMVKKKKQENSCENEAVEASA